MLLLHNITNRASHQPAGEDPKAEPRLFSVHFKFSLCLFMRNKRLLALVHLFIGKTEDVGVVKIEVVFFSFYERSFTYELSLIL